jgi:PAS domain S-box-containing protein
MGLRAPPPKPRRVSRHIPISAVKSSEKTTNSKDDTPACVEGLEVQGRILEATLSSMSDFAYTLDPAGRLVYLNQTSLDFLGLTSQEALGKSFFDLHFPEKLALELQAQVRDVIATGNSVIDSDQYVSPSGRIRYYEYVFIPVFGSVGKVEFVVGTARDITVRKVAEEHLKQMEARYRRLLDAAPDGMVVVNDAGEILLLNAQAERQFGYRRDELVGKKVTRIIPDGFAELLIAHGGETLAESLRRLIGIGIELGGRRKDRSDVHLEVMLSPLESREGTLITAATRDISIRKDAERHLAQMEARYRGLLEAAPDGMVVVNGAGEIILLNCQAEKQFGYRRDELLGQQIETIIPKGFAERLVADDRRTPAEALAQQIGTGIELHGKKKDGRDFPIEIMLSPLEGEDGILVTAAVRDISERKQLMRQLQQSQKMDAVGQLTGGIAHDFNNLLTVVIGNLGLLELLVPTNEAALKRIKTAQKAAARGVDITRRLLVFSRNDELDPALTSLGDSIQNMIEMAYRSLGSNITITTKIDQSIPPVFVDPAGFESALLNLLVNARDAMPNGGEVVVSSQRTDLDEKDPGVKAGILKPGPYVCIGVADRGQGMSPETLERACDPFFTTKPRDKGTGLGLAMVYGFAKQSNGIVRLNSVLGCGTTVSMYLPIPPTVVSPLKLVVPVTPSPRLVETILVVDDEPDSLALAFTILTGKGMNVMQAGDIGSALRTIAECSDLDLLIVDLAMPGEVNTFELVRRARVLRPAIKVIYSSKVCPATQPAENISELDGPFLQKPYKRADVDEIVRHIAQSSNLKSTELHYDYSALLPTDEHERSITDKQIVLVIDDDADIGELVCATSKAIGVQCIATKKAAVFLENLGPEITLILLDLMMPGLDGIELLRELGKRSCKIDIVLMSSVGKRTMESAVQLARVLGLSVVGQLHKPFQQADLERVLKAIRPPVARTVVQPSPQFSIQREDLQNAIVRNEFVVFYQPQVKIDTGHVVGVEALVRWQHPKRGLIFPDRFIGRMEKFGLIDELGWIVANRGMIDVRLFTRIDEVPLTLSLNASVNSLCDLKFPDILASVAQAHKIPPSDITIEVTETGLIKELSRTLDILTRLRMKQFKLSIDDFGTGYAMMQQFKTIPATELKIDKCFVQEMMENNRDRVMVQKTVEMGHELGMQVMAEGVETQEQFDFLAFHGCDCAQGYFFSPPIPAKEMVVWLKEYRLGKPKRRQGK